MISLLVLDPPAKLIPDVLDPPPSFLVPVVLLVPGLLIEISELIDSGKVLALSETCSKPLSLVQLMFMLAFTIERVRGILKSLGWYYPMFQYHCQNNLL